MQRQFLHSPIGDFAHNDFVRTAAIEFMCRPEFLQKLARRSELPDNFSVQLHVSGAAQSSRKNLCFAPPLRLNGFYDQVVDRPVNLLKPMRNSRGDHDDVAFFELVDLGIRDVLCG